jgi:hypothetical protein
MIEKIVLAIAITCSLYWSTSWSNNVKPQPRQAAIESSRYVEVFIVTTA